MMTLPLNLPPSSINGDHCLSCEFLVTMKLPISLFRFHVQFRCIFARNCFVVIYYKQRNLVKPSLPTLYAAFARGRYMHEIYEVAGEITMREKGQL